MLKSQFEIKNSFVLKYELIHIVLTLLLYKLLLWHIGWVPYEDNPWATRYEYSSFVTIYFLYLLLKYLIDLFIICWLVVNSIIKIKTKSILFGNIIIILIVVVAKIIDHYIFNVIADWILN